MTTKNSSDGGPEGSSESFKGWFEPRKHDGRFEYFEECIAEGKAEGRPTDFWERMLEKNRRKDALICRVARESLDLYRPIFSAIQRGEEIVSAADSEEEGVQTYGFLLEPLKAEIDDAWDPWREAAETSIREEEFGEDEIPWILSGVQAECEQLLQGEGTVDIAGD